MALKKIILIDGNVAQDVRQILNGSGTSDGQRMLGLKPYDSETILAGNKYISALRTIRDLMEEFGIDQQLYQ